jgi:TRAP-type mannitol/chloroaromatic compound transport system permease large subunit
METAGLWMLLAVAALMVLTGLPAWIVLLGVALVSCVIGLVAGVFAVPLLSALPARMLGLLENDLLQAMPLYVLMGALLYRLPLADILMRAGSRALAWTGAGPALAGLGLSVVLAPMNGSVGAGAAMLTRTVLPRLDANGIPRERGAALVTVASTLGVVIPPSLVLILLSDAMLRAHTEAVNVTHSALRIVNTQDVFRGALIPAAILLLLCAAVTWIMSPRTRAAGGDTAVTRSDWFTAAATILVIVGLFACVTLGRLYAVEAAAAGGMAMFLYGLARRALPWSILKDVLRDTMALSGALFALLIGATVFTLIVRAFGTDRWVAGLLAPTSSDGIYGPLATVMSILGLCAFVLDAFEMTFVVIPVIMPPLLIRVPDATWVAVLTLLILQTSFLIPPFGYAVLMLRNRLAQRLDGRRFVRALMPYLLAQIAVMTMVAACPRLVSQQHATLAEPAAHQLSDEEANELLRQQIEPADPGQDPQAPR